MEDGSKPDVEGILDGSQAPEGLDRPQAADIQQHLQVRDRLRRALGSRRAPEDLALRIRQAVGVDARPSEPPSSGWVVRFPWRRVSAVSSAAAIVLLGLTIYLGLSRPSADRPAGRAVKYAQGLLEHIHEENVLPVPAFHRESDPGRLRQYLSSYSGLAPVFPREANAIVTGGAVSALMGKKVASYVVRTESGPVTLVVTRIAPEELRFDRQLSTDDGLTLWACGFGRCRMVCLRVGEHTYVAVGARSLGSRRLQQLLTDVHRTARAVSPAPSAAMR
jgi:hypothetical protein